MRPIVWLVLTLCLGAAPLAAQPVTYSVGVEENDYLPSHHLVDGQYQGGFRVLLDAFAADSGLRLVYKPFPVSRLLQSFLDGECDFKFPDNDYWNAPAKGRAGITYSDPVVTYVDGVFVRLDQMGKGADHLKTLAIVRGFTPITWLERVQQHRLSVIEAPSVAAILTMVQAGRADGAYLSVSVGLTNLEMLGAGPALGFDPALPYTRSSYRLSSIKYPQVVAEFNRWMRSHSDKVRQIREQFGLERGL